MGVGEGGGDPSNLHTPFPKILNWITAGLVIMILFLELLWLNWVYLTKQW